jgi:DNA polymerase
MGNGMQVDAVGIVHAVPDKGLSLPNGLHIQYPNLIHLRNAEGKNEWVYQSKGMGVKVYGGKVVENFCQAVARCIIAEQMLRIAKRYKVVLTVHDAIAIVAKVEEADEARRFVEDSMRWRPLWALDLPLACESGMGASYGDC